MHKDKGKTTSTLTGDQVKYHSVDGTCGGWKLS